MGHGSILASFGLFLTLFNNSLQRSALKSFLPVRYFLLLLGLSSLYCGFIYNEFFAMPTQIFKSCYQIENKSQWSLAGGPTDKGLYFYGREDFNCVYPAGVDPVWGLSSQKLTFANNIKMKLSVIMGIVHMTIGVLMKGTNTLFRRDWPSFFFEVVTGLVMLLGMFGWMDLLIYGKWFFPLEYASRQVVTVKGKPEFLGDMVNRLTPSVINIMITTIFGGGKVPEGVLQYSFLQEGEVAYPINKDVMQAQQDSMYSTSVTLLLCAMVCIPLMLLVKPCCCRPKSHAHAVEEIEFTQIQNTTSINDDEGGIIQHRQK